MTRLSFKYVLSDNQGKILKTSKQFNFSLSHYIYALYKRVLACNTKTIDEYYRLLKLAINSKNCGYIYWLFTSKNNPTNHKVKQLQESCFALLQAFGYFAFEDILQTAPAFISYIAKTGGKRGKLFLSCPNGTSGMSFHKSVNHSAPKHPFKKLYMTSFRVNNANYSIVQNDGTYILDVIDPEFEQCHDLRGYIESTDEKEKRFIDGLSERRNIVITRNIEGISFDIVLSKYEGQELNEDSYTDGKILISTRIREH